MTERVAFRYSVGILSILGGLAGLIGLYLIEVPPGNRDAMMLALGLVLGWGSTVVNGEWGSSPAGRKAAEVGVRLAEVPLAPTGTPENPTVIEGAGPDSEVVMTAPHRGRRP